MGKSTQIRLDWSLVRRLIFGSPLSTEQLSHQRLPKILALPIFASDALSSTAYATQAILLNLLIAGPHVLHLTVPISIAIVVLLWIVVISYTQTVMRIRRVGARISFRARIWASGGGFWRLPPSSPTTC